MAVYVLAYVIVKLAHLVVVYHVVEALVIVMVCVMYNVVLVVDHLLLVVLREKDVCLLLVRPQAENKKINLKYNID